jgi:hypothetical protein
LSAGNSNGNQQPLSVKARLVLCGFVAAFFVYQPLAILVPPELPGAGPARKKKQHYKYTIAHNSFTSTARSSVLMHMSGFIAIQLKGTSHFPRAAIVPSLFGEKCNENMHSMLRDTGQQCSSAVTPQQLLKRLGDVATNMHEDSSGYFQAVCGRKDAHRDAVGANDSPVWRQRVSVHDVHDFVQLGITICTDLLRSEGFAPVLRKYPTFRKAYTALITLGKPSSSNSAVKWQWLIPPAATQVTPDCHAWCALCWLIGCVLSSMLRQ